MYISRFVLLYESPGEIKPSNLLLRNMGSFNLVRIKWAAGITQRIQTPYYNQVRNITIQLSKTASCQGFKLAIRMYC